MYMGMSFSTRTIQISFYRTQVRTLPCLVTQTLVGWGPPCVLDSHSPLLLNFAQIVGFFKVVLRWISLKWLHVFVNIDTWICQNWCMSCSRPLPNKTQLKFDQNFSGCWSVCFALKALNESKYSMPWVRCAFGNVLWYGPPWIILFFQCKHGNLE